MTELCNFENAAGRPPAFNLTFHIESESAGELRAPAVFIISTLYLTDYAGVRDGARWRL